MRSCYETWLAEPACNKYTRGGNSKPLSRSLLCKWVKSCWESVPTEMAKESFLSCAITTSTDSSDDHNIYCFKPGQPCEAGRSILEAETQKHLVASADKGVHVDPFATDTDDEEVKNNEVLIDEENDVAPEESESDNSTTQF